MAEQPLSGIRVAEFSTGAVIPLCGELMAVMGAEVIRVESRRKPDIQRVMVDPITRTNLGLNRVWGFNDINCNKYSVSLDLTRPQGLEMALRLIALSDVLIENFSAGVIDRLGLGYDCVRRIRPNIIMVSSSGSGHTGPEAGMMANAPLFVAISGVGEMTGYRHGPPFEGRGSSDMINAFTNFYAIMAALHHRAETGEGQYLDSSSREGQICMIGDSVMDYTLNGRVPTRNANYDDSLAPHNCYGCKGEDKWVSIVAATEEEWAALCQAMGNPEWAKQDKFATNFSRRQHQEELDELIEKWTLNYTPYEVMDILQRAGVAAVPSFTAEDIYTDPHLLERGLFEVVEHPEAGASPVLMAPWRFSGAGPTFTRHAPLLGQDNDYVLGHLLGLSPQEIATLEEAKVLW